MILTQVLGLNRGICLGQRGRDSMCSRTYLYVGHPSVALGKPGGPDLSADAFHSRPAIAHLIKILSLTINGDETWAYPRVIYHPSAPGLQTAAAIFRAAPHGPSRAASGPTTRAVTQAQPDMVSIIGQALPSLRAAIGAPAKTKYYAAFEASAWMLTGRSEDSNPFPRTASPGLREQNTSKNFERSYLSLAFTYLLNCRWCDAQLSMRRGAIPRQYLQ